MICPKCQTPNADGSKFCIKCGEPLQNVPQMPEQNVGVVNNNIELPKQEEIPNVAPTLNSGFATPNVQIQNTQTNNTTSNVTNQKKGSFNLVKFLLSSIKSPISAFEENKDSLGDPRNSLLVGGIVAVFMMIANLIKTVLTLVVSNYDGIEINFDMLEYVKFSDLIFKNLLIYIAVIAVIAFVYYVAGLIIKKTPNFLRLISMTAVSLIPFTLLSTLLATILSYIWSPLSVIAMILGAVCTLVFFINLVDMEFTFEKKDQKVFFHIICLSVIFIVGYFAIMKIISGEISDDFGDFSDFFG